MIDAKIVMTDEAVASLVGLAPHWRVVMIGPRPLGHPNPVVLQVGYVVTRTSEEAVEWAYAWAEHVCDMYDYRYDPDDWSVGGVVPVNQN